MFDSLPGWLDLLLTVTAETFVTRIRLSRPIYYFTTLDTVIQDILLYNYCGSAGLPSKRLGLQFVLIYFVELLRTSQAVQFKTVFCWYTVCPCHRGRYLQFFESCITNTWNLGSLQNAENEANLLLPLGIQKLKGFQLQGGFAPWPSDQGLCPWTPLGAQPPDPRYRPALHARHVCPPHIFWPGDAPAGSAESRDLVCKGGEITTYLESSTPHCLFTIWLLLGYDDEWRQMAVYRTFPLWSDFGTVPAVDHVTCK